jgi:methylglutamate dehydrogenase subunit B
MRIPCPFCGERDHSEFVFSGPADIARPAFTEAEPTRAAFEAVYLRENPKGPSTELWYHQSGCRGWLRVRRDTSTHEIFSCELAKPV